MKQKIVVQMYLNSDKERSKAMQIASVRKGVNSVAIKGEAKDRVEVIGDGVDSVELTKSLRKKFSCSLFWCFGMKKSSRSANLESVEVVKAKDDEAKEEKSQPISYYHQYPPPTFMYQTISDPNPPLCSIM